MRKINYLYYITLASMLFLTSCVKTEVDIENNGSNGENSGGSEGTDNPEVTLTKEYLAGEWMLFYNLKQIKNNETETEGTYYRYPDIEGRLITYDLNGNYAEKNTWDSILSQGTYTIKLKTSTTEKDSISYLETGKTIANTYAYPFISENYFTRYNKYGIQDETTDKLFFVADTWYFRKSDSNYQLAADNPRIYTKTLITPSSLFYTWEFTAYKYYYNGTSKVQAGLDELIGSTYTFASDYTYQVKNILTGAVDYGEYKIIDDIVQVRRNGTINGIDTIITQKFWIKDGLKTTSTGTTFDNYSKDRDVDNFSNVIEELDTYKKVE